MMFLFNALGRIEYISESLNNEDGDILEEEYF